MAGSPNYHTYDELLSAMERSGKSYDLKMLGEAYKVALKAHEGQKRVSGVDYILHPISVAYILVELGMDSSVVAAALLHDVVEDTNVTKQDLEKKFGKEIMNLVDGVTKLGKIPSTSREEQQAENIKKILLATSQDIRVILVKLADRLQNMRTIGCMPVQKRRDKSLQNMEVFAPIAHRLGIRTMKDELEDISLKCLDPIAYAEVESSLALRREDREKFIDLIKKRIMDRVQKVIPDVCIEGRVKSANEIYKKMFIKGRSMDQIYDIYAVRVIVSTVNDCYNVFGIIHDMFQPIPSRFKDYISTPKPNMYQSLHTTVLSKEGIPFEVQIRTWDMHRTAEYGIAAHWKYKLGITGKDNSWMKSLSWVRKLLENHKNASDITDVIGNIKSDLVPKEIFVLTPRGDVINLPKGSTVIDFAYEIHSDLGNHMIGAKVNKNIVPLSYVLKTGEIVEIISTKDSNKGPSRDWLGVVKTSEARNKIRQWFKREKREENIVEGKNKVELELSKHGIIIPENKMAEFLDPVVKKNQCETLEDFFASVGYGGIQLWRLVPRLKNDYINRSRNNFKSSDHGFTESKAIKESRSISGVIVDNIKNCEVRFSKCCNPIPGDEIVGFVTRRRGISIHKKCCKNVSDDVVCENDRRLIDVQWSGAEGSMFESSLEIDANDRDGLLADITKKINNMNLKLYSLSSKISQGNRVLVHVTLDIKNIDHLKSVINNISQVKGINSIKKL